MSFFNTTAMRRGARALSSYRNVAETLKGAAKAVDQTAARAALKGLEAAEQVRNVVGSGVKGAKETGGRAKEVSGEAAGKAAGAAKEYTGAAAGKADELAGKAKGAYGESRS